MCATALSRANNKETPQSVPRGARMVLKDYSDKEAVQSREYGLVSTRERLTYTSYIFAGSFPGHAAQMVKLSIFQVLINIVHQTRWTFDLKIEATHNYASLFRTRSHDECK